MSAPHLPSGRSRAIPFPLPEDWTPEQALAVLELLDDLRAVLYAHYLIPLQDLLREQALANPDPQHPISASDDDCPF